MGCCVRGTRSAVPTFVEDFSGAHFCGTSLMWRWQCCSLLFLYKKLGNESKVREIVDEYAQNISLIEGKSEKEMLKEIGEFLEKIE